MIINNNDCQILILDEFVWMKAKRNRCHCFPDVSLANDNRRRQCDQMLE